MKIYKYTLAEKLGIGKCVTALGFFDGVHLAHRMLLSKARQKADALELPLAVFTFTAECDFLKNDSPRIYGTKEKLKIFEDIGIDACIIADFSSISEISAENFITDVLLRDIGTEVAVSGYNFKYGKGALGDAALLKKIMSRNGKNSIIIDEVSFNGSAVSSTLIRELIKAGDIHGANKLLGGKYFFTGEVVHGRGDGHEFGFPTVNTELPSSRQLPKLGVYKTEIPIDGVNYTGLTNIGVCPTFGERSVHLETYILDYSGDLYGRELNIFLVDFIREEKRFKDKDELIKQINVDINTILRGNADK